jgi:signal transduction histidine kinase
MSLTWRILLVALLLNLLTVGTVQVVVYLSQEDWLRRERDGLLEPVLDSLSLLERVYAPGLLGSARQVRPLVLSPAIREVYDDVIVTSGRPGYEGLIYLNPRGASHRDPDSFPHGEILAGMERAARAGGILPVAGGYAYCIRQGAEIAGYLWFVPRHPETSPTAPMLWSALAAVLVSTLAFGLLLVWVVRRTVGQPLQSLSRAAEQVASGHYDVRLPAAERLGELAPLVATFNRMAGQVQGHTALLQSEVRAAVEEAKQKERALVLSARLASIGTLAAGVAHEINNPIGGMQNAVHRLLQQPDLAPRQRTYLELVQDGLQRVARTARRLLDFSPRQVAAAAFPLRQAVDSALALVEHRLGKQGVELALQFEPDLPAIHGDPHEIQQVVLNLLLNSMDAFEGRGRGGRITIRAERHGDRVVLAVEDDGPGMAAADLPHVFDPFFSKKERPDASGLGMFICYSIVQNHGGTIAVASEPGAGFRVRIELPAVSPPPAG